MKNKLIHCLLGALFLFGCNAKQNTIHNSIDEEKQTTINDDKIFREIELTNNDVIQHIDYLITWDSTYSTEYVQHETMKEYTTNLTIQINQVRNGFVTYSGSSTLNFCFEWKYSQDSKEYTNFTNVIVPIKFSEINQSTFFTKEFVFKTTSDEYGYSKPIQSEIPYVNYSKNNSPIVKSLTASDTHMKATYYNYGISGDYSLTYKSYEITIANYSYYFSVSSLSSSSSLFGHTNCTYIAPINSTELYDYRITLTINGEEITLLRNGYYFFNKLLDGSSITNIKGFIDVYPGRVI